MKNRHKVRVCICVVHLLADEIKNLGGTFGIYVCLKEMEGEEKKYLKQAQNAQVKRKSVFFYLPTQIVLTKPAHPHSAASQSSLNA